MQPQEQPGTTDQPTKAAEKAREQRAPTMITLSVPERESQDDHQAADNDAGRSGPSPWYDLWAQGLMAFWTFWQLVLTGVGIYFLKETLKATREAVIDTGEATKAMIAANELVRQQARASIGVPAVEIQLGFKVSEDDTPTFATPFVILKNYGKNAASDVALRAFGYIRGGVGGVISVAPLDDYSQPILIGTIEGGVDARIPLERIWPLERSDLALIEQGASFDIFGQVEFTDDLGGRHSVLFDRFVSGPDTLTDPKWAYRNPADRQNKK